MSIEQLTAIRKHLESALGTVNVMMDAEPTKPEAPTTPAPEQPTHPEPTDPKPEEPTDPEPDPAPSPEPDPAPAPNPTPPPATPKPPATTDDLVDGLRSGATPCGASAGTDVAKCTDPGVSVTPTLVTINQNLKSFTGWDIGTRRLLLKARVGTMSIYSMGGQSGKLPLIWCRPGGGFDLMEFSSILNHRGSMILKQDPGAFAGEITRSDFRGMSQDALKVGGDNLIHENLFADGIHPGGDPHADVLTVMSAEGEVAFCNNYVDWNWINVIVENGMNNWFRIEAYAAYSGRYDDVIIESNALRQQNPRSSAIQVTSKNTPVWDGSIQVRNNRMDKAGGNHKIMHKPSNRISEWSGNTDFAGNDIPYSDT